MSEPIILVHRAQVYPHAMPVRYGVELDVRPFGETVVLSHGPTVWTDPIDEGDLCRVDHFLLGGQRRCDVRPCYAWHLREDGVEEPLARLLADFPEVRERSFVFGGSYPTMRRAKGLGLSTTQRISEEEPWETVSGRPTPHCWLDRWNWDADIAYYEPDQNPEDFTQQRIYVPQWARVWAASPELHVGHSPWAWLQHHWWIFFRLGVAGICTDHPVECEQAYEAWKAEGKK